MTPKDLYEWAVEHGVENCDIEIQYRDEGGGHCGTTNASFDEIEIENKSYGGSYCYLENMIRDVPEINVVDQWR